MNSITNNKTEIKGVPSDAEMRESNASSQSDGTFSVAVESPFDTREDSISKITNFIFSYKETTKQNISFETIQDYNSKLPFSFTDNELLEIYNKAIEELKIEISPTLSFSELMEQSFPKARFVIEPFFEQGTVNMVSAPPNTWKSWLLFLCSAHIAQGTSLFGRFDTEQSKVLIVNEEDSFRAIQDRFRILDITDTSLPIFFRVANGSKLESKFINNLLEEIKQKEIKVVIFDSLRSMHEADENDSTAMQKILDQMKKIAREGVTVIFTHHHRKKGLFEKGSSAESSRGSSAINAAISGHISLDEEERELGLYLIIRHLKSKAGEKLPPFEIKIVKEENKVKFVYDGEFKQAEKKIKQTKDEIMDLLKDGKWKATKDFEENIKVSKTILRQALTSLKNDGILVHINRKQAIAKLIPVAPKGHPKELYYSLNTESTEMVVREDEVMEQAYTNF